MSRLKQINTCNPETVKILLIALLGMGFLPYLLNSLYANPWTDDLSYSAFSRENGFLASQAYWYMNWTGRYLSTAMLSANPLVFDWLWGYKLIPVFLIMLLLCTTWFLISELTEGIFSFKEELLFAQMTILVYLDQMPDVRPGLYWMASSLTYQMGAILFLLFLAILYRTKKRQKERHAVFCSVVILLLAAFLPGTNEVILALLLPAFSIVLILDYKNLKRISLFLYGTFLVLFAGVCTALFAPGNMARLAGYEGGRDLPRVIHLTAEATFTSLAMWVGNPNILLLALVVAVTTFRSSQLQAHLRRIHPVLSLALFILVIFGCYFPPFWSMGLYPPRRVVNLIFLFFILGWLLNIAVFTSYFASRGFRFPTKISMNIVALSVIAHLVFFLSLGDSNSLLIAKDLISGRSHRYDQELQQRYAYLQIDTTTDAIVEQLKNTPQSLFFSDIHYYKDSWVNHWYAIYFGKKSIVLKKL